MRKSREPGGIGRHDGQLSRDPQDGVVAGIEAAQERQRIRAVAVSARQGWRGGVAGSGRWIGGGQEQEGDTRVEGTGGEAIEGYDLEAEADGRRRARECEARGEEVSVTRASWWSVGQLGQPRSSR
jgi:hypothetical protein